MNLKRIVQICFLVSLLPGLLSGCSSLARGLAEDQYREAMLDGRMSPTEYMQKKEEIRRASESMN